MRVYILSGIAAVATGVALAVPAGPGFWIACALRTGAFAGLLALALRWRGALERRARLGLVKPAAVRRLRLYAVGAALAALASATAPALA